MFSRPALFLMAFAVTPAALLFGSSSAQTRGKTGHKRLSSLRTAPASASPADSAFAREIAPLVKQFCSGCHSGSAAAAGISLTGYKDAAAVLKARKIWEKVSQNVNLGNMPPPNAPQPTQAQREKLVAWIDGLISQADCQLQDPGRVTMRRLNREEYNNTVRDLFGVDLRPADSFPSDDVGYGFDNIGDVLSISPLLMEKYLTAAEKISQAVIVTPEAQTKTVRFPAEKLSGGNGVGDGGVVLASNGEVGVDYDFPKDGSYLVSIRASGQQAGPEPVKMEIRLDSKGIQTEEVRAVAEKPETYQVRVRTTTGRKHVGAAFLNDYYNPQAPDPKDRGDRNLVVDFIEVKGPLGLQGPLPESHRRIIDCPPGEIAHVDCAARILAKFARRAFRRPVTKQEVERLTRYVALAQKEGESFERGIQIAIQAALVSPHFLFRVEIDPNPNNPKAKHFVRPYEMASRLSYFLWSSMPDEELLSLAAKGKLLEPSVLAAQVKRMLKDPRARALADNFASQWLTLRNLNNVAPDPERFPTFNDGLRKAMRTETEMFFESIVREDRSLLEFLDAKYTFLNEPLAKHYGIEGIAGEQFRRIALTGDQRGGLLSQASILTVTSNPTRTSPVKRGKWVLEQLLGTPPPPAPPGVPELADDKKDKGPLTGTLRQRMEQHRKNPICASCHARMDPLGFGLENYDAVGRWRTKDGEFAVDASGVLPGGQAFNGPAQLKKILLAKKPLFIRSFSEKLLTYALGRGLELTDKCEVDAIAKAVTKNNDRFSALVTAIVQSDPFRKRRGDGGPKP